MKKVFIILSLIFACAFSAFVLSSCSGFYLASDGGADGGKKSNSSGGTATYAIDVSRVSLNSTGKTVKEGDVFTLTATVYPSNATDKTVTWSSSDTSVATVSRGTVTARKQGVATIIVSTNNGKIATCTVTVESAVVEDPTVEVVSVSISERSKTVVPGDAFTLTATVNPSNATDKTIVWSSSDTSVATVSGGNVKAIKQGKAVISAKSNNGKTSSCTVTVTEPQIAVAAYIDGNLYNTVYTSKTANYKIAPPTVEDDITTNPNSDKYFYGWFLDGNFQTPLTDDCTFNQNSKIYGKWITVYSNSFQYTVSNGYATITGFTKTTATVVVVPAYINSFPVKTIGSGKRGYDVNGTYRTDLGAFENCTMIRTAIICDGIQNIDNKAFKDCNSMTEIKIPDSVTSIGNSAFSGCNSLKYNEYDNAYTFLPETRSYNNRLHEIEEELEEKKDREEQEAQRAESLRSKYYWSK